MNNDVYDSDDYLPTSVPLPARTREVTTRTRREKRSAKGGSNFHI